MPAKNALPGVNLVGHLDNADGLGEAARQVGGALRAGGFEVREFRVGEPVRPADLHPLSLICVNPDGLPALAAQSGPELFSRPTAGLWWWESSVFPAGLGWAFDYLDEVWVGSSFIADALRPHASIPVERLTIPVEPVPPSQPPPPAPGAPGAFTFCFLFDYISSARKNPGGVLEAFTGEFASGEGAKLVLKGSNPAANPPAAAELRAAAASHPHVHLIEETLSAADKNALIAGCDCYVSLHRAEGFGLTIAEAMYFGRPVIATGWSGSQELMDDECAYAVGYELRPVTDLGEDPWPYRPLGEWAEPDRAEASALMRRVFEDPEEGRARGRAAAEHVRSERSAAAAVASINERVEGLAGQPPAGGRGTPIPESTSQRARRLVERGPAPGPRGPRNPLSAARSSLLRALRPFTAHQREVDVELLETIAELEARIGRLEASREGGGPRR